MLSKTFFAWLRLLRCKVHPWKHILITCWQVIRTQGRQAAATTRLMIAFAKLDHLSLISLLNDCLW